MSMIGGDVVGDNALYRDEELREVLAETQRVKQPLGRMPLRRWTLAALWVLRLYVATMIVLIGLKFLQLAGLVG